MPRVRRRRPGRVDTRNRNWCGTLNNPTSCLFAAFDGDLDSVKFAKYQLEVGDNGTLHYQFCVAFAEKKSLSQVKVLFPRAHLEIARDLHASMAYAEKVSTRLASDRYAEFGSWITADLAVGSIGNYVGSGRGTRNDLHAVQAALDEGKPMSEIANDHFGTYMRFHRGMTAYRLLRAKQRSWPTITTVYFGIPGSGKTTLINEQAGPDAYWLRKSNAGAIWFDGYDGHDDVVIDEFYGWIQRGLLQRLCDRFPLMVDTKGGAVPFVAKRIWISSNQRPEKWFPKLKLGAMRRRLQEPLGRVLMTSAIGVEPTVYELLEDDDPELNFYHV